MMRTVGARVAARSFSFSAPLNRHLVGANHREITYPIAGKAPKEVSDLNEACALIKSGDNVFVQGIAATPTPLLNALCDHAKQNNLRDIKLHHLHLEGPTRWIEPEFKDRIRSNSLFTGHNLRKAINDGTADFNSCFLQEVPLLFRRGAIKLKAALLHVSPPDEYGFCSMGTSVDTTRAAATTAKHIIALCNKNMPRTFGDTLIHSSQFDVLVEDHNHQLHQRATVELGETSIRIGQIIADNLVDNGATLQMGIGGVPDAALAALKNHKNLGVHTEMFSDGVLPLLECNAINNSQKYHYPGRVLTSFVYGSKKLYDFLNNNPIIHFGDVQWVNDPAVIRKNPKVTAINSAVEVDLTGQVVADSVGRRFLSGFGGQVDFIRGAAISDDDQGKPIIALPSTANKGQSKIVPHISEGSGVVTSRSHVHYVVTEHGIAMLWGKNMRQRAHALIQIAHPDHRESLEKSAFERYKVMPSAD